MKIEDKFTKKEKEKLDGLDIIAENVYNEVNRLEKTRLKLLRNLIPNNEIPKIFSC